MELYIIKEEMYKKDDLKTLNSTKCFYYIDKELASECLRNKIEKYNDYLVPVSKNVWKNNFWHYTVYMEIDTINLK